MSGSQAFPKLGEQSLEEHGLIHFHLDQLERALHSFDALQATPETLRTLAVRMRAHLDNAGRLAPLLDQHPAVSRVYYPGLASHPGHRLAARQQSGFGAMISFELEEGLPAVERVVKKLRHFSLAESLGGGESLIAHPATMTHASMDPEARRVAGISDSLLRISVGIEDVDDLVADLTAALAEMV